MVREHATGIELRGGREAVTAALLDPRGVSARVRRDHATLRALLDDVERACAAARERRPGSLDKFLRAVWELYLSFEEHLAMEELLVAPILRARVDRGDERAVAMFVEHNEQRAKLLELVDDTETDTKDIDALVVQAAAVVAAFRVDMVNEEVSLAAIDLD